jgi:hypothetical protein
MNLARFSNDRTALTCIFCISEVHLNVGQWLVASAIRGTDSHERPARSHLERDFLTRASGRDRDSLELDLAAPARPVGREAVRLFLGPEDIVAGTKIIEGELSIVVRGYGLRDIASVAATHESRTDLGCGNWRIILIHRNAGYAP